MENQALLDRLIGSMSIEDKIELLEKVWRSLSSGQSEFISPAWHGQILADRKKKLNLASRLFRTGMRRKRECWECHDIDTLIIEFLLNAKSNVTIYTLRGHE